MPSNIVTYTAVRILTAVAITIVSMLPKSAEAQGASESYKNYTPRMCLAAMQRIGDFVNRASLDTAPYNPAADTIPSLLRESAQRCLASFDVNTVDIKVLRGLIMVYLAANDDTSTHIAVTRYVAAASTPAEQAARLSDIISSTLSSAYFAGAAFHPRPDIAAEYLTRLMQLRGDSVWQSQQAAYRSLVAYYLEHRDIDAALSAWGKRIRIIGNVPAAQREIQVDAEDVLSLFFLAIQEERGGGTAARTLIDSVMASLADLRDTTIVPFLRSTLQSFPFGKPAIPLKADFVIGADQNIQFPRPGAVTYLLWDVDREYAAVLRRVKAILGDSVEFVLVKPTEGHFHGQVALTAQQEVDSLRHYYLEAIGFPGVIVISETTFQPLPDGRYLPDDEPNYTKYRSYFAPLPVIVDRKGTIQPTAAFPWHPFVEKTLLNDIRAIYNPSMWQF